MYSILGSSALAYLAGSGTDRETLGDAPSPNATLTMTRSVGHPSRSAPIHQPRRHGVVGASASAMLSKPRW
jgi:hypothetical protein